MTTIAIISSDSHQSNGRKFYTKLVKNFTVNEKKTDQEHAPTILVNLPHSNVDEFKLKCYLALSFGAEYFVINEHDITLEMISSMKNDDYLKSLNFHLLSNENTDIIIDDIFIKSLILKENPYSFNKIAFDDIINNKIHSYIQKVSKQDKIIGIIGGAGPLASAQYYELLSAKRIYYVGLDDTLAPGKNNSIMNHSDQEDNARVHFIPHYINDVNLLKPYVNYLSIPCNTAHAHLDKFNINKIEMVDIRDSIINKIFLQNKNNPNITNELHVNEVAIFATPATIKAKLYETKLSENKVLFKVPDAETLDEIYKIINRVKEKTDIDLIRRDFLNLVKSFRDKFNEKNYWIILGCTELSVLFEEEDCVSKKFISSTHTLANLVRSQVQKSKEPQPSRIDHQIDEDTHAQSVAKYIAGGRRRSNSSNNHEPISTSVELKKPSILDILSRKPKRSNSISNANNNLSIHTLNRKKSINIPENIDKTKTEGFRR